MRASSSRNRAFRAIAMWRAVVAIRERPLTHLSELAVGRLEPVREVRVAVAELLGQVEREPGGDLAAAVDGVRGAAGRASPPAERGRTRGSRAARARSRRARCGSGSRRARPGARRAAGGARGRRRSRPWRRRGRGRAPRSRASRRASPRSYGRWSSTKNRSRPNASATRAAPFGLYAPSPCRAQPERQTSPSFRSRSDSRVNAGGSGSSRASAACRRAPRSAAGRGSRSPSASRRAA